MIDLIRKLTTHFAVGMFAALAAVQTIRADSADIDIRVDPSVVLSRISDDFIGFGYETSAVAQSNYFSADNQTLVRLYRNLSTHGLIRIGGNVSDHTRFVPDGIAEPKTERDVTTINNAGLKSLGGFARATGWKVMWGLNLGTGSKEEAVREAVAVDAALGTNLHSFEIGNEVDALRRFSRNYNDYHAAFTDYKTGIRAALPRAKFSGPDVIGNWQWITNFAGSESGDMQLLTQHYYRGGAVQPSSTLAKLLQNDHGFDTRLGKLRQLCQSHDLRFRINEVNSYSGGGKPGVSDTFGSALWVLDYMFKLASFGCDGVNMETDVNQLGFISHYSPIVHDQTGHCHARPEYYGMLAFSLAAKGDLVQLTTSGTNSGFSAYATKDGTRSLWLTAINRSFTQPIRLNVHLPAGYSGVRLFCLSAPSMESKDRVTFADSEVSAEGTWTLPKPKPLPVFANPLELQLPAAGATILNFF